MLFFHVLYLVFAGQGATTDARRGVDGGNLRPSRQLIYSRGVADFAAFCNKRGVPTLLAPSDALRTYIYHCTTDHGLYAQIVKGRMSALGDRHSR